MGAGGMIADGVVVAGAVPVPAGAVGEALPIPPPAAAGLASPETLTVEMFSSEAGPLSLLGLRVRTAAAHRKIQIAATTMVMRVKTSPALVPKAL